MFHHSYQLGRHFPNLNAHRGLDTWFGLVTLSMTGKARIVCKTVFIVVSLLHLKSELES